MPAASRAAVLCSSGNRLHREGRTATEAAGATLKVGLQLLDVRGPDDLPKAFDAITRQRADGLLVLPDSVTNAHRKSIVAFAASRRLPAMYAFREAVDDGGLMCYGPNLVENFRAAAGYVDKILKGATAGDLPIAQATKFDLVIKLEDGQDARSDHPAVAPAAGRQGDRVTAEEGMGSADILPLGTKESQLTPRSSGRASRAAHRGRYAEFA